MGLIPVLRSGRPECPVTSISGHLIPFSGLYDPLYSYDIHTEENTHKHTIKCKMDHVIGNSFLIVFFLSTTCLPEKFLPDPMYIDIEVYKSASVQKNSSSNLF